MLKRTSQNSSTNGTKRIRPSDSAVKDANNGRKPYTLDEKAKFLALYNQEKERNPFVSLGAIAKMEGIHPNTALKMVQNEAQILHAVDTLPGQATKVVARQRKREMQAVEDALFKWYQKQQQYGLPVDDSRLRGTAIVIWMELRTLYRPERLPKAIAFSLGWLRGFKRLRGIKKYKAHGESGSVDLEQWRTRIEEIQLILAGFDLEDIYNCDETGIYLKAMSFDTLANGPVHGRKIVRAARVTILFCANATGSSKLKPFVLSKSEPRGMTAQTREAVDADYGGSGYMDEELFSTWLLGLDHDMQDQQRKIALLIDSAPGHCGSEDIGLQNITTIRLPPGTTSVTQPLDAGIIRSFKVLYSREMLQLVASRRELARSKKESITNGELWSIIPRAWSMVSPECIRNGFAHVPIMHDEHRRKLRELGVETRADQVGHLQEQLKEKYLGNEDVISEQKDFAVLHYLDMVECDGPTEATLSSIREVMEDQKYEGDFLSMEEHEIVDEDESDADEELDPDFYISSQQSYSSVDTPAYSLRSGDRPREYAFDNASPPSSPFLEEMMEPDYIEDTFLKFRQMRDSAKQRGDQALMAHLVGITTSIDVLADRFGLEAQEQEHVVRLD